MILKANGCFCYPVVLGSAHNKKNWKASKFIGNCSDLIILSLCVCVSAAAAAVCALDCESPDIFPGDSSYRLHDCKL